MKRSRAVVGLVSAGALLLGCTGTTENPTSSATSSSGPVESSITAVTTTATTTATTAAATTAEGGGTESRSAVLDQAIADLVAMPGGPPGVVAVVQVGDEKSVHVGGVADVGTGAAPTADDHMRIASVAKAFSGAAALALVDAGTVSLDDTIGQHLPDLPPAWAEVTLRQLLNHTSGVPDFVRTEGFGAAVQAAFGTPLPPAELIAFAADLPLEFPAGTEYRYSNSENIIVGLMLQAAAGRPYEEILSQFVYEPLGLLNTSLPTGTDLPTPTLHGYDWAPPEPLTDITTLLAAGWAWASGGVVSTPDDLNTFIRGYVGGELFDDDVRREQQATFIPGATSEPPAPGFNSASLALFRYETECGTMLGHTGNTFGYTQFAAATPDGDRSATVSITLQRTHDGEGQDLKVFQGLQRVELAAMCLALGG